MEEPRVRLSRKIRLVGKRLKMNFANDKTVELWKSFMPERKKISNIKGEDLYCVQIYDYQDDEEIFSFEMPFEKWAAVEVSSFDNIPEGMETMTIECDWYAVYTHKGPASAFREQYDAIFEPWYEYALYEIVSRPFFQVMGKKYKNDSPDSEEEIWIPVKRLDLKKYVKIEWIPKK